MALEIPLSSTRRRPQFQTQLMVELFPNDPRHEAVFFNTGGSSITIEGVMFSRRGFPHPMGEQGAPIGSPWRMVE